MAGEVARSAPAYGNRNAHPKGPPLTGEHDVSLLGENLPPLRGISFPVAGCGLSPTDGGPAGETRRGTGAASDPHHDLAPGSRLWARP